VSARPQVSSGEPALARRPAPIDGERPLVWLPVASAAAAVGGAIVAAPLPRVVAVVVVMMAIASRGRILLVVGVALLTSSLGSAALDGLDRALPARVDGEITLVTDPVADGVGVRVEARHEGVRYRATAYGPVAWALERALAGDRVTVRSTTHPRPAHSPWFVQRHLAGSLQIEQIVGRRDAAPLQRFTNAVRRTIERGASSIGRDRRGLYTGLVYGDDRGQPAILVDDFRASGLGHLLAVSGQNVAFMLAVAAPVLLRTTYRVRTPLVILLLVGFATATRFEPSVLRATTMAGVAAVAAHCGRKVVGGHVLALAVTLLCIVDPLLVRSLGFQLSVLASAGILLLAAPLAERVPGPRPLASAFATTVAAQLAVAPLQVGVFGGVAPVSLVANLLAVPVAGLLMTWGLTGGVLAGLVPPLAPLLHVPTRAGLWWIAEVAHAGGRAPLGELGPWHLAALLGLGATATAALRRGRPAIAIVAALASLGAIVTPGVAAWQAPPGAVEVAPGVVLWRGAAGSDGRGAVVVLDPAARPEDALGGLRRAGVRRIDLVLAGRGSRRLGEVVAALDDRWPLGAVWAPSDHQIRGARVAPLGRWRVPGLAVEVRAVEEVLDASVTIALPGPAGQPLASPP
jgi:competence protein ComEC